MLADVSWKLINPFGLGIIHITLNELSYVDFKFICLVAMPNNAFKASITSLLMSIIRRLKVLLASRNLFHNWLSAGIRYYLINRGLVNGDIDVKFKCNNNNYILSRWIYSLIINAYYDGLFKTLCNGELIGKFYSVIDLLYKNGKFILRMPDGVLLTVDSFNSIIIETWLYDIHYLGFNLNNWFILDIGAFVGDTALYYAKRGAFVVAIEPLLSNYEIMVKNLELNPELKSRIIPINAAIANEDGFIEFKHNTTFDIILHLMVVLQYITLIVDLLLRLSL